MLLKSNITLTNNSELFYSSSNVPENFLSRGYIEIEIESPVVTGNVDYISGAPMKPFFLTFLIFDEEDEEIHDPNIAPKVDYKNYGRISMAISTQFT